MPLPELALFAQAPGATFGAKIASFSGSLAYAKIWRSPAKPFKLIDLVITEDLLRSGALDS
jgi:hypothetical protein